MILSVDTGGTKTLIVAYSAEGDALQTQKFPTPKDRGEYIAAVVAELQRLNEELGPISGICFALPGVVRDQKVVICKNLGWTDFDLLGELSGHFPSTPMWLENDANLGGVGAAHLLETVPRHLLYLTISTGINGGFIVDGSIEPTLSESELGDVSFEFEGQLSQWENIASGRAIMDKYGLYANQLSDPEAIRDVSVRISRGLLALLPALRPDIVAIGGGVGAHYELFAEHVSRELEVLPEQYRCPIVTAPHPEEIVAHGGYFYAKHRLAL